MTRSPEREGQWLLDALGRAPVLAILRAHDGSSLVEPALTLFDAGVALVEISLTTPGACAAIEEVAARMPAHAHVGAGTVLTVEDVADVSAAGAEFVVTPALAESVAASVRRGIPVAAGALTPSEVLSAHQLGATAVKIFPASVVGPSYLKALQAPFPDVPLVAVGGVDVEQAREHLRSGARGVGVGSPLQQDAASGGDLAALAARARVYLQAAREAAGS